VNDPGSTGYLAPANKYNLPDACSNIFRYDGDELPYLVLHSGLMKNAHGPVADTVHHILYVCPNRSLPAMPLLPTKEPSVQFLLVSYGIILV